MLLMDFYTVLKTLISEKIKIGLKITKVNYTNDSHLNSTLVNLNVFECRVAMCFTNNSSISGWYISSLSLYKLINFLIFASIISKSPFGSMFLFLFKT